jgi:hypothetical protein
MALTHQLVKKLKLLATKMQYDRMLANRFYSIVSQNLFSHQQELKLI